MRDEERALESPPEEEVVEQIWSPCPRTRTVLDGLLSLDTVLLDDVFQTRATLMQTVPKCRRGAYRCALRHALDGIRTGVEREDEELQARA